MKFSAFGGANLREEIETHATAEEQDYFTKKSLSFSPPRGVG
jgi:hypothetical protein